MPRDFRTPVSGSLVDKVDAIKAQLGIAADTPIPLAVEDAAKQLQVVLSNGCGLPERVELCFAALFGEQTAPPAPPTLPPPPPITMTSEAPGPSQMASTTTIKTEEVSAAHCVTSYPALLSYLESLELSSMLGLLDARGGASSLLEWFAEHARSQLSPSSGCDTQPAWVAWMAEVRPRPSEPAERWITLWATDEKAARRALLALQMDRGHLCVRLHREPATSSEGLPTSQMASLLQRWAHERNSYELLLAEDVTEGATEGSTEDGTDTIDAAAVMTADATKPASAEAGVLVAMLRAVSGDVLERLHRQRESAAMSDLSLARVKLDELSAALLRSDPKSTLTVAPGERAGSYTLTQMRYHGHTVEISVPVDKYTKVDDLLRVATMSCTCCAAAPDDDAEDTGAPAGRGLM